MRSFPITPPAGRLIRLNRRGAGSAVTRPPFGKMDAHMTDAQLLTLAMAFIVPISLLLYSNSRITEAKEALRADLRSLRTEMQAGFERIEAKITVHELEHHRH